MYKLILLSALLMALFGCGTDSSFTGTNGSNGATGATGATGSNAAAPICATYTIYCVDKDGDKIIDSALAEEASIDVDGQMACTLKAVK